MSKTCHSEYGKIDTLFIKHVKDAFISDKIIDEQWEQLNYLGKPDFNQAISEYANFEKLLKANCNEVKYLSHDEGVGMDSIYCRDAAIATDHGMIICNMGKEARKQEPAAELAAFEQQNIPVLGAIKTPGTLEGGDVAWLDESTLAVGHTYRSNQEGIQQLRDLLSPFGIRVVHISLPHYKGQSDVFHLMSILSPVDKDLAVVYSPLMPIFFRNLLIDRDYSLIEVPDEEFDSMGCNVLAFGPRKCLMVDGNPITKSRLEEAGCEVITYTGEEISVKGGGGPTCLTRPIWRTH